MAVLINSYIPTSADIVGGQFNVTPPTLTDGQCSVLELDATGALKVNVVAGGGSGSNAAAGPTGSPVPADADYQGVNIGGILTGVTGLALGATTKAPTVAIVDGSGNQITSFGGGTQYADGTTQATPTGTVALGKNPSNILHSLALDATGNLEVVVNAPLPAGTNVIGHVIVDSGSITVSGTVTANQGTAAALAGAWPVEVTDGTNILGTSSHPIRVDPTGTTTQPVSGTVSVTGFANPLPVSQSGLWNVNQAIGVAGFGKITDGTNTAAVKASSTAAVAADPALVVAVSPNNTILVQGAAAADAAQSGNPVLIAGVDGSGNVQEVPVGDQGTTAPAQVLIVGGVDSSGNINRPAVNSGVLSIITAGSVGDGFPNSQLALPVSSGAVPGLLMVAPTVFNGTTWDRLRASSGTGSVQVGGYLTTGAAIAAIADAPILIGGVYNNPQPTVANGSVAQLQSTAAGALIVAPGTDVFRVTDISIIDLLQTLILETRAMRSALVYMITENGDVRDSDFDPNNQDFQPVN